jgi:hypothetical protein
MARNDLHGETLNRILKDLGDLGFQMTKEAMDALSGRLALALATAYKDGWADALIAVMGKLRRHIDLTA